MFITNKTRTHCRQQVNSRIVKSFKTWIATVVNNIITTKSGIKLRQLCKYSKMDQIVPITVPQYCSSITRIHSHNFGLFLKGTEYTYKLLTIHDSSPLQLPVNFDEIGNTLHLEKALPSWQVKASVFRSAQYKPSGTELQLTSKFAGLSFSDSVMNY